MNKEKVKIFFVGFFMSAIFGIFYLYYGGKFHFYIPCLFHELCGYYCPGCGITRMFYSILKLDLYQAFRYNAFLFCLLPFAVFYCIYIFICWIHDKCFFLPTKRFIYMILILFLFFGIIRNIPYFSYWAPLLLRK